MSRVMNYGGARAGRRCSHFNIASSPSFPHSCRFVSATSSPRRLQHSEKRTPEDPLPQRLRLGNQIARKRVIAAVFEH